MSSDSERKPVTALFADVVGSTAFLEQMDPEEWSDILNRAFGLMSEAVLRYEGSIGHLLGDGLLAFFGSPIAHEDDPERAVRASLDMMAAIKDLSADLKQSKGLDFQIRIGLNSGTVIVGDVGSDLRHQFTAIGDAVNVAARIQGEAAPGSILAAAPTFRFIQPHFETRYAGDLNLKGKAEPVPAYEILGTKESRGTDRGLPGLVSSMVGRDGPLSEVSELLHDTDTAGRGTVILLVGEPGIGKSRLLRELRLRHDGPAVWSEGRCLSYRRSVPYGLIVDLVHSVLSGPAQATPEQMLSHLDSSLEGMSPQEAGETRRYLAHLLRLPLAPAEWDPIQKLTPDVRHERLLASLRRWLIHIGASTPRVLVCEDVHWADSSSGEALTSLVEAIANLPVCFLLSSRPEPDSPIRSMTSTARDVLGRRFREIRLGPLSQDEARHLVAQLLEMESLPSEVRELIFRKAEGNPLFVEEVIRMLIEQGAITREGNKWVAAAGIPRVVVPANLQGLLLARIDRLPEGAKQIARVASVIGREFHPSVLSEVLGDSEERPSIESSLQELAAFGLVTPPDATGNYSFRHALVEEAVYESVLQRDRIRLHGLVGEALERSDPEGRPDKAAELARHFERSGDTRRAGRYVVEAAQDALRRFAHREAFELFGKAQSLLSTLPDEADLLEARVLTGLGKYRAGVTFIPGTEELELLEELLPQTERLRNLELTAQIHLAIAETRHEMGEIPEISPPLERSIAALEQISQAGGEDSLRALPLALRGFSHFAAARYRDAVRVLEEAVPLLEQHAPMWQAAFYSGVLAISAARLGEFELADRWLERQGSLAAASGDPNALLDADLHHGVVEGERGNHTQALVYAKRGTATAEQVDNKACALVGHFIIGDQHLKLGMAQEALESLERSSEIAEFCNVADIENLSRAWLSAVRADLGLGENPLAELDEALLSARQMGDRLSEGEILRQRGIVKAKLPEPDWDGAQEDFESSIALFQKLETLPYVARALRDYGMALQAGKQIGAGLEKLQAARELFEQLNMATGDEPSKASSLNSAP